MYRTSCGINRYSRAVIRHSHQITPHRPYSRPSAPQHHHTLSQKTDSRSLPPAVQGNSSNIITIVAVSVTLLAGTTVIYRHFSPFPRTEEEAIKERFLEEDNNAIMTGTPAPGRPGNLTPDQEKKLKEFWSATLNVFGVLDIANGDDTPTGMTDSQRARANTLGSEKTKKRKSMFSRKNEEATEGADGMAGMDGEDKYGQAKAFHKLLETQSPEDLRRAFWSMVKHDNPDALLLRFLRARKWHVQNALVMLIATMHWRLTEMKVDDDIMRRGEGGAVEDSASSNAAVKKEAQDFLQQMRMGKSFLYGTDKEGRPICFVRVKLHKQGEQTEASLERYTVFIIETARLFLHDNVDTAAVVFDMTDFSMANMDYGPVRFMIKCFEANYPESLGVVLVHKSPWIFQGIWKIIRGWLDPVVAAKVHFTRNVEELSEFIPMNHITAELGGKDTWQYSYSESRLGENDIVKDKATRDILVDERAAVVKEYESMTQQWLHGRPDNDVQEKRKELTEKLRKGYWELDPYVRARTYYDRTGMLGPGGRVQFYTSENGAKHTEGTTQNGPVPAGYADDGVD